LPAEALEAHGAHLVKEAALAKKGTVNDGGGLDTMTQLLLGRGYGARETLNAAFVASTADLITRWQEPDGIWKAAGQLPSRRWPRDTADQTTTMWTLLALGTLDKPAPHIQRAMALAVGAAKKGKPDKNHEWLVARL